MMRRARATTISPAGVRETLRPRSTICTPRVRSSWAICALNAGPLAVRLSMEAVDQGPEMSLYEGLLLEANHFGLLAATQDMKEGLTAFLEKRTAKFQGR